MRRILKSPCALRSALCALLLAAICLLPAASWAALAISPTAVSITRILGQALPPAQSVQVSVASGQVWQICDAMPWADTAMPGGSGASCPPNQGGWQRTDSGSLTITPNATMAGLAAGTYQDQITVTAGSEVFVLPVTVAVSAGLPPSGGASGLGLQFLPEPGGSILLWWSPITVSAAGNPIPPPLYRIMRRRQQDVLYAELAAGVASPIYQDKQVLRGEAYCYMVYAYLPQQSERGQSAPGNEICVLAVHGQ